MDFDSIEGLNPEEIDKLFNINEDSDYISNFFICACKATLGDKGTHLKKYPAYSGWCYQFVDAELKFSSVTCSQQCIDVYGNSSHPHKFGVVYESPGVCNHTGNPSGFTKEWGCHAFGSHCNGYFYHWHTWHTACAQEYAWMNRTFGECYFLR